jgi:predicted DsbA family dithiol-disulfide isomerase
MKKRYSDLNKSGELFGIRFGERSFLSNSRLALEASEFARDKGRYDSFHERIFRAYFVYLLDIGDLSVLLNLAGEEGLDAVELDRRLREGFYTSRLEESMREAARYGINAVPTFIINETENIVGAQPLTSFRAGLKRMQGA